ncbi:hypothetical protein [Hydrogenimonas thermophila]|uniref:Uncharacterized protein n=1 Tax=Hydrogenimonas thermophila TaxID=223786 RepID=A0A1I5RR80_9BACT|nr:hypothetical protein [Hydrogenimonas thermophila]SFP61018.1 hypothetical protein SAMN05216234_12826 [Hydrogenimonas thermophila]
MILEKEVVQALEGLAKDIIDTDKKEDYMFENHIDKEIIDKLNAMDIEKTTDEIAKRAISDVKELEEQGLL